MSTNSYGQIFKSTFLFAFVQVYRAVISIIKNKLAAILIGSEGIGMLGIFNTTMQMIQAGAGLGISQSAVRDTSEANGSGDPSRFSKIINITNQIILYTGLFGCFVTLILSYFLSFWTFGDNAHIVAYIVLSFAVALNIINESKQAILKGMRQLKSLAFANIIGSSAGLCVSAPLYYFFGKEGIVPELLIGALIAVIVANHFIDKIEYMKQTLPLKDVLKESKPMIQMGTALMAVTFLQTIVAFVINAYIRNKGGLHDVGYYTAGIAILTSYFGVVVNALMTDYYPRIAAVNTDNNAIQEELNKQSVVSLIICCPLFVLFMSLLPMFITLLYSDEFRPTVEFVRWSIYWSLITICSNQVDMIMVAKYQVRTFFSISVISRIIQLLSCIFLYNLHGLEGLGFAYLLMGVWHMSIYSIVVYKKYKIRFSNQFIKIALIVLMFAVSSSILQTFEGTMLYYIASSLLFFTSCAFSFIVMKKVTGVYFVSFVKNRLGKKR